MNNKTIDTLELLIELALQVRDDLMAKYGTVRNQCATGTENLIKLAAAHNIKLEWGTGWYFGGIAHNWAVYGEWFIDPTINQFKKEPDDVVVYRADDKDYIRFDEEMLSYVTRGASADALERYWRAKDALIKYGKILHTIGEFKHEERVDKKGRKYTYHSFKVEFDLSLGRKAMSEWQIRSALVFENSNGYTVAAIMAKAVMSKEKGLRTPTEIHRFVVKRTKTGKHLFLYKNQDTGKLERIKDEDWSWDIHALVPAPVRQSPFGTSRYGDGIKVIRDADEYDPFGDE